MYTGIAAAGFCAIMAGLALFQLALAAGVPLGRYAWGGQHARLPTGLRIGSLVSIVIYGLFCVIVLQRAGRIDLLPHPSIADTGIWVVTAYMALGVLVNAISRSKPERLVMTPLVLILGLLALVVALEL